MSIATTSIATIGEIARWHGQPIHRIAYVIRSRRIQPCGWAGNSRVFSEDTVAVITAELRLIAEKKGHDRIPCQDL